MHRANSEGDSCPSPLIDQILRESRSEEVGMRRIRNLQTGKRLTVL